MSPPASHAPSPPLPRNHRRENGDDEEQRRAIHQEPHEGEADHEDDAEELVERPPDTSSTTRPIVDPGDGPSEAQEVSPTSSPTPRALPLPTITASQSRPRRTLTGERTSAVSPNRETEARSGWTRSRRNPRRGYVPRVRPRSPSYWTPSASRRSATRCRGRAPGRTPRNIGGTSPSTAHSAGTPAHRDARMGPPPPPRRGPRLVAEERVFGLPGARPESAPSCSGDPVPLFIVGMLLASRDPLPSAEAGGVQPSLASTHSS